MHIEFDVQPVRLRDSSRWLKRSVKPLDHDRLIKRTLKGCKKIVLAPLQGAHDDYQFTGGLRFAATSGYYLATLRVAKSERHIGR